MLAAKTNALLDTLITAMADALIGSDTDLHDERQVVRTLVGAGFGPTDILDLHAQVIATAKAKSGARR